MGKVKIEAGVNGLDGEYEIDTSSFSNKELHVVKMETGLRPLELTEALEQGDTDVVVAIAALALMRNGWETRRAWGMLWEITAGAITLDFDDVVEGDEGGPPAPEPLPQDNVSGDVNGSGSGNFGETSKPSLEVAAEIDPDTTGART